MIIKSITIAFIGLLIAAPMNVDQPKAIKSTDNNSTEIHEAPIVPVVDIKEVAPLEPIAAEPIAEIAPIEEAVIVEAPVEPAPSAPSQSNVSMSGQDIMRAAGVPESDWYYADCVINGCEGVSPEGGWNGAQRWNTAGSGAYGICQALPANKMSQAGEDYMTNPVTQMKWCHAYAQAYGGWNQAFQFRKCLGSCYSARTGGYVNKDHTWW